MKFAVAALLATAVVANTDGDTTEELSFAECRPVAVTFFDDENCTSPYSGTDENILAAEAAIEDEMNRMITSEGNCAELGPGYWGTFECNWDEVCVKIDDDENCSEAANAQEEYCEPIGAC